MIKMSKFAAIVLSLLLILTSIIPASALAAGSVSNQDAQLCETLGMLIGEGNGLTEEYLAKTPTRIQAATLFLRLKGLYNEAANYVGASNFDDVSKTSWATNIMAYLKAHPELGMVGVGDNKFSPDTYINAQAYYKILLEALGYKTGTDFQWEDTISFAGSKGLSRAANTANFTLNDLATATVEALKANVKGSVDTLAGTLARSGVFTSVQTNALTAANIGLVTTNLNVKVKNASTISVTFNAKVTDISKLSFSLYKEDVASAVDSLSSSWSEDGLELSIKRAVNFDAGTYTLKIMYDNKIIDTRSLTIDKEKVASIVFSPEVVILTSDIKGEIKYTAYNQYGEDISKSDLMKKVIWATSVDSVNVDIVNTKLVVTKNGTAGVSQLKDTDMVAISGYDGKDAAVTAQLKVSDGYGIIKDIKFLGIRNKDGIKDITVDSKDNFYIDFEAYDDSGKIVDSYTVLSNVGNFGLYSSNPSIKAHVIRDPDNSSKALIEIDTHTEAGTAEISGVVLATGKKATINVEVKKGITLTNFKINAPATGVPIEERVELPFEAYDQNGNKITDYDLINGKALFVVSSGGTATILGERSSTGEFILTGYFNQVSTYTIKVVIVDANTSYDYTVVTKTGSVPTTISAIDRNIICDAIVENGEMRIDFVKNPAFTILDQNGAVMDLSKNNVFGGKYYYIYATTVDPNKVSVDTNNNLAYKDNTIIITGGHTNGSTTVTFELCADTDLAPSRGKEVMDVKDVTIYNVDRKEIIDYTFGSIPTLYANPEVSAANTYTTISLQKQQYAGDIKIYGKLAGNKTVALDPVIGSGRNVLTVTVTDAKKFNVDLANRKVLAKPYGSETEVSDKLTATIQGANGIIKTISTDINSSTAAPIAQSIEAVVKPGSSITRAKDTFTMSLSTFKGSIMGKELRKYNTSGYGADTADIYFAIKDQYGVTGLTPTYFAIITNDGTTNVKIDEASGEISGTAYSGDQYIVTAVTNNGITKSITINIQ